MSGLSQGVDLREVDEFGDHMLGCMSSLPTRTRLWHDPLVEAWLMLARMAGLSCAKKVRNLMLHSGKRPDVAIHPQGTAQHHHGCSDCRRC